MPRGPPLDHRAGRRLEKLPFLGSQPDRQGTAPALLEVGAGACGRIDEKSGRGEGLFSRDTRIDQPQPSGGGPAHRLAGGDHFHGRPRADQPREPHRPSPPGQQTELYLWESQHRGLGGSRHPVIAGEGNLQPSPQTDAVDDGDGRPGIGGEAAVEMTPIGTGLLDHGRLGSEDRLQPIDVSPGEERPRPPGTDHDGPGRRAGLERVERLAQIPEELAIDDVLAPAPGDDFERDHAAGVTRRHDRTTRVAGGPGGRRSRRRSRLKGTGDHGVSGEMGADSEGVGIPSACPPAENR